MTVDMYQPVVCHVQTGQVIETLEEPSMDRAAAERRGAQFDRDVDLYSRLLNTPSCLRSAVLEGYFVPCRVTFADGTGVDVGGEFAVSEQETANGHGPVELPQEARTVVVTGAAGG